MNNTDQTSSILYFKLILDKCDADNHGIEKLNFYFSGRLILLDGI